MTYTFLTCNHMAQGARLSTAVPQQPLGTRSPASTQGSSRAGSAWFFHVLKPKPAMSSARSSPVPACNRREATTSVIRWPSGPCLNNSARLPVPSKGIFTQQPHWFWDCLSPLYMLVQLLNCHLTLLQRKTRSTGSPLLSNLSRCQLVLGFFSRTTYSWQFLISFHLPGCPGMFHALHAFNCAFS